MAQLYSNMKIFHYREKLDSLPADSAAIESPLHIRLKPTNVCNHNCWYCAYRKDDIQLGKDMSITDQIPREKMRELVEDFIAMGVKAVTFSGGGEPFCYPYLGETCRQLAAGKIKFASLTNGSRLQGEAAEIFAHAATWLRVSLDGWDGPSYAAYRGVKEDEFAKVIGNLEGFKKLGGACYLGVTLIVDQKNGAHVYDLIKILNHVGVNSVKVSPCLVSNDGQESNAYHQSCYQLVTEQVERALSDFGSDSFEIFNSYQAQLTTFAKDYTWCPYIQINPVIGADLNVYSCHDKAYNFDSGLLFSIKEQRFQDAWFADKKAFFAINPQQHCNHHCVVNAKNKLILEYLDVDRDHLAFV